MTLEQIQSMWKVDSVIDQIDLDKASLNTPSLHAKYLELLNEKRLSLKSYEVRYNTLLKKKWFDLQKAELHFRSQAIVPQIPSRLTQ